MRYVVLTACLALVGCAGPIVWKSGPKDTFRQNSFDCKREAHTFRNPTARGFAALADDDYERKMYIECMEARGYSQ